jgi:ABC-type amino acid transport substrate-binding protein
MTISARTLGIGCTAAFLAGGAAYAQEACTTYTVAAGDNLRFIARSAYGDADLYRVVYDANVSVIGENVDIIEIGTQLVLPCSKESAAVETAAADPTAGTESVTPVAAATETAPAAPEMKQFGIVTGNGYAPFADETLPGGGMFTQLVEMAIFRADPKITYNLTFINDWQAHLDALLPSGAYDLSFPWIRPNCEAPETLSPNDQIRCNDFVFSGPMYEIVDGFFAMRDSGLAQAINYEDFQGKRICRPEGYTTGVLEAAGLTASTVSLVRPTDGADCFRALAAGEVDLVSIDAEVGDSVIASLGLTTQVDQNPHLMSLLSLHVIAHKSNPDAVAMIGKLDQGVIEMYESGEWYDIVSTALTNNNLQQ